MKKVLVSLGMLILFIMPIFTQSFVSYATIDEDFADDSVIVIIPFIANDAQEQDNVVGSGIYLYRIKTADETLIKKMLLLK